MDFVEEHMVRSAGAASGARDGAADDCDVLPGAFRDGELRDAVAGIAPAGASPHWP